MNFHPHIHAIVLGGGLDPKNHWKDNGEVFFLPAKVISRVFRGKYLAELKQLWIDDHHLPCPFPLLGADRPRLAVADV